eukprot:scaffold283_cov186-Amphora_coffeaeformis.AAC.4
MSAEYNDSNDKDDDQDEYVDAWTFTLECPPGTAAVEDGATTTTTTTTTTTLPSGWQRVRLQQVQPSSSPSSSSSSSYNNNNNTTRQSPQSPQEVVEDTDERAALLLDKNNNRPTSSASSSSSTTTTTTTRHGGWTFTSPYLQVSASNLVTLTYRPAWQAIPEYTTASARACCSCSSRCWKALCSTCGGGGGGSGSGSGATSTEYVDFYKHTWTVSDIVKVQRVENLTLPGMGDCRALRVQLRPLPLAHTIADDDVPAGLQAAWRRHVQHMQDERNHDDDAYATPFTPMDATTDSSSATQYHNQDNDEDDEYCPILWIALPCSQMDPPLLWRFQLPAPDDTTPIAVETITMLQGMVQSCSPMTSSSSSPQPPPPPPPPTHIFINGYQSWSFTGSLVRGHAQPQPALPSFLSRAFNFGGSPPPPATVTTTAGEHTTTPTNTPTTTSIPPPPPKKMMYQSDFFTCVTSDGTAPPLGPLLRGSGETKFPFQTLDERGGPAWIVGWLSQRHQFGVIEVDETLEHVHMHCSAHGQILLPPSLLLSSSSSKNNNDANTTPRRRRRRVITTDWAHAQLLSPHSYDEEPLVHFFHAVAGYNAARPLQNGNLLVGWCSWYHYYENISQQVLRDNFAKLAGLRTKVPMNVSVVDDGYMTAWGDWDSLKPNKFTDGGLQTVAADIAQNHMRPGLWLAPFAADKHSQLTRQHPDWVIHNDAGVAANSSNCGKFFYGLDATHPDIRQHVTTAIRRAVVDWKFRVLKIDFLYAACLHGNGKYDLSLSRAQAMHMALDTIRKAAGPDTFLIGCGCPVASAIGYVDGMRVSADTGPTWYPAFPLPWWDHGTLPCLRSMIRNSMARAPMGHRWWHNDPDCLLLGESTRLTIQEVASAASIVAMTCGMMLLSDDLTNVSVERMRVLCKIFPMAGATAVVLDLHSTNDGLPSLLRLWATDRYASVMETFRENHMQQIIPGDSVSNLEHMEATFFARQASFNLDDLSMGPNERKRSCLHVCKGLGTWTIVSISNWSDKPAVLHIPPPALLPPPPTVFDEDQADTFLEGENEEESGEFGFHAFAFWSSKYTWLPHHAAESDSHDDPALLSRRLGPHETEIYHIKPVTPNFPQYVGSDLHFSCGKEVHRFEVKSMERNGSSGTVVDIQLNPAFNRVGHVFLYLPVTQTEHVRVKVKNDVGHWSVVGNTPQVGSNGSPRLVGRVIRIMVVVHADESPHDGNIQVSF